jgi:hypothetical protein
VDGEIVQDTSSLPFVRQVGWAITEHVVWIEFRDAVVQDGPLAPAPAANQVYGVPLFVRPGFVFTLGEDLQAVFSHRITFEDDGLVVIENNSMLTQLP